MHATLPLLRATDFPAIHRKTLETLQVNLGYRCNQSCTHCHVAAGPNRTEQMSPQNVDAVVAFLARHRIPTLDVTGGAPELHPLFRALVAREGTSENLVGIRSGRSFAPDPRREGVRPYVGAHE